VLLKIPHGRHGMDFEIPEVGRVFFEGGHSLERVSSPRRAPQRTVGNLFTINYLDGRIKFGSAIMCGAWHLCEKLTLVNNFHYCIG
jgi:hypothetical protein